MRIPTREKYIDERVGIWFIFGRNTDSGLADVSDQDRDIFTSIPEDIAEQLCTLQEEFRNKLYKILCYEED